MINVEIGYGCLICVTKCRHVAIALALSRGIIKHPVIMVG